MTYLAFLGLFLAAPLALVLALCPRVRTARGLTTVAGVLLISVPAAALWDQAAVGRGLWTYGTSQILGLWIGRVPVEEFLFFGLQIALVASLSERWLGRARIQ